MFFSYIFPVLVVTMLVASIWSVFTKKGRLLQTKGFFWGGKMLKDYGWLDDAGNINPVTKQRIQVIKYEKDNEVFHVLIVKDTSVTSVQMMPVKLSDQEARRLVTILTDKS